MNEDQMHRFLMIAGMVMTILAGLGTVGLLVACAVGFTWSLLFCSILLGGATVGFGSATSFYGGKVTGHPKVFTNAAEREVLNRRQRQDLRKVRGEVVMQRALDEVEKERQNITHRQIEAANDPSKPPFKTQWSPDGVQSEVSRLSERRDRDDSYER